MMPVFLLFVVVNALVITLRNRLEQMGFQVDVLMIGNLFLCIVTVLSFYLLYKGLRSPSTQVFLRSVYGSFITKLLVCAGAVLIYSAIMEKQVNYPAIFTLLFLYLFYTYLEIRTLLTIMKKDPNA
jgi:hypothetical protein